MAVRSGLFPEVSGYLVAVAATAVAVLARLTLVAVAGDQVPFFPFLLAVLVAAWYGGLKPGLLATGLSGGLGFSLLGQPFGSWWAERPGATPLTAMFLVVGVITSSLCGALHAARRRTEEKRRRLEEAEEQVRTVLHHVIDGILTIDEGGTVQSINPAVERMFGYPASEVVGRNVKVLIPEPHLADCLRTEQAKVLGVGREVGGRRKDGSTFPMDLAVSEFRLGGRRYLTGIVRDITERKRVEEEVRRLNGELRGRLDELQTILNVVPVGVAIALDPACRRISLNSYMGELLGVPVGANASLSAPPGERPTSYTLFQAGKEVPPAELPMQTACTGVEVRDCEIDLVRPGRDTRNLLCFARPLHDRDGRVRGSVGAFLDITELKKAEQALLEADRRKDEFLATLAHELRNPLAPLRTGLQVMRLARGDRATVEQVQGMMERQLAQMVRLIDDLLDVSRITRGKLEIRKERVELAAVVSSAVETGRPLTEEMGQELTVTLPKQPILLEADLTRLAQVFANLLTNAAKYTDRGGRIWLTAERQGGEVVVTVKDTGIGISPEHLPRLFQMFSQVERSLERSQGGLGIGLTLVKRLVEMHGGKVEVRSEGPGKGAEFVVRLPVAAGASGGQAENGEGGPAAPKSSLRILVVDDNRDGADSLATMLRLMGHDTRTAYDGQEGVEAAGTFHPEVVLLDIGLPRLDGYQACRRIREQAGGRQVVLVAITGWGQGEDKRRAAEAGFNHHLTKPVDPADLEKLLSGLKRT
jgi:PAS domain S-box-containing protein